MPHARPSRRNYPLSRVQGPVHPFGREHFRCQGWKCYRSAIIRSQSQDPTKSKAYRYLCYRCYERYPHKDLPHDTHDLDDESADLPDSEDDVKEAITSYENHSASSDITQCAGKLKKKVRFEDDVHAQSPEEKDKYEVVLVWSSQHCQLERFHRKITRSVDDNTGWQDKDLQRGIAWKNIWVDAKPARFGYLCVHDGWWAWHQVWTPSQRLHCINNEWQLREAYDCKLDACRKWALTKFWGDWRHAVIINKWSALLCRPWSAYLCRQWLRVKCVRRTFMTIRMSFMRTHFRIWYNTLSRVQGIRALWLERTVLHRLAQQQRQSLTIALHQWLRRFSIVPMVEVRTHFRIWYNELDLARTLFARWSQHALTQTVECISLETRLFVLECS